MNAIFAAVICLSTVILIITAPDKFLSSMLGGAREAAECALTLFCIYAVWMGLSALAEKSGLSQKASKALKPVARRFFKCDDEVAVENLAMNISCNLLGIGGAATPYAVKAINRLEEKGNDFAQKLLFVINATSVQILPTTVIALRASAGSTSAADIFLPSLICTIVSTTLGVGLYLLGRKICR